MIIFRGRYLLFCCHLLILLCLTTSVHAGTEEEMQILQLFYNENDLVVTASRYPKPISRVADNMTVITAEDITAINAHTLPDVLLNVTGLQSAIIGSPGSLSNVVIQGSGIRHVLVVVDGVVQNNLGDAVADVGAIPVQNIERIEIIKGPASSSWGSSLGGVINIITKSPDESRPFGGTGYAAIGERNTGDYRVEFSGKSGKFGYYLNGGGLTSDGLLPHNAMDGGNLYSKLTWTPSARTGLTASLGYTKNSREIGVFQDFTFDNGNENFFSAVSLDHSFTDQLSLNALLRFMHRDASLTNTIAAAGISQEIVARDANYGGSVKLLWERGPHQAVIGTDFDLGRFEFRNTLRTEQELVKAAKENLDRFAVYANDTIAFGKFTFIPGIRYDYTSTNGDFISPSMGVTCAVTSDTILRGYVARGFNVPPLGFTVGTGLFNEPNPDLDMEEVVSYSLGLETAELKYVWIKTTLFRHDIKDLMTVVPVSPDANRSMVINAGKQRRQGLEVEARTMPVYNTSLSVGYAFIEARDRETGETVKGVPRYTFDVALHYDDRRYFRGNLKGHYVWWNSFPDENGKYTAMIWDLNLAKTVFTDGNRAVDLFFTAHNIFNGSQYQTNAFKNPGRWFEGGLRFAF